MKLHYNPKLKVLSRELRKNSTLAEILLWEQLKSRKLRGLQFARQKPVGEYIVDFYCPKLGLVLEIDGSSHDTRLEKDAVRQAYLESIGLKVIRFLDIDVKNNLHGVLSQLELEISATKSIRKK